MKLPVREKTATGQPSTDEDVLQELAADYPLPKVLLEHRALSKLKSTYTDKLPQMVNRAHRARAHDVRAGDRGDGTPRVERPEPAEHPGAHRRRAAHSRGVHRAAGHVLVSADYSQIELRIMAHLSRDPALLKAFREGADIHRATAAEIFGVPARRGDAGAAALHQGGQLRPDLRHGRVRPGAAARHRARRGAAVHRQVFRSAIPAWPTTWSARASSRASRATSRRCSAGGSGCRTSTPAAARGARAPSARRSTRRCRARRPT